MRAVVSGAVVAGILIGVFLFWNAGRLSERELSIARGLSLASLPPVPPDAGNAVADNPQAAAFGKELFHDTGLSANNRISCATCHIEDRQFQDDRALGQGIGTTERRTMPLNGVAHATWFFWDGRKDSLWAQAMAPIENPAEHGFSRSEVAAYIAQNYRAKYTALFGSLPDLTGIPPAGPLGDAIQQTAWERMPKEKRQDINRVFTNAAKSIAAFERTLLPVENRFDRYIDALLNGRKPDGRSALNRQELSGFRVFTGQGRCIECHNGPLLSDGFFHNTGVPERAGVPADRGRVSVIDTIQSDPFGCLGLYSDAATNECAKLKFMLRDKFVLTGAFKSPGLRGVADRPPYMHAGQIDTLEQVIEHYNNAPFTFTGKSEIQPVKLSFKQRAALLAFLKTL